MEWPLKSDPGRIILLAVLLTGFLPAAAQAQEIVRGKRKIYETWIYLEHPAEKIRGVLYETRDSSIVVSQSRIRTDYPPKIFQGSEYDYSQLKDIRIRRLNSLQRGAIIGGISGFYLIFIGTALGDEVPLWASFLVSVPAAATGAGIGALAGSIKIRIPLYGNYQAYSMNRDKLNYFSYLENTAYARHEHENYFALFAGPSFPMGEFRSITTDTTSIKIHNGYNSEFAFFAKLAPDLGLKISFFDNQYEAGIPSSGYWYIWSGIGIGPVLSFPASKKIWFDVEPGLCFGNVSLMKDETEIHSGAGLTFITGSTARYNIASRWCLMAGARYSLAKLRMNNNTKTVAQAFDLRFGAGYRFR
jgi:hypothetical protein